MVSDPQGASAHQARKSALVLGALGVVYGDIGTSPIYTVREAVAAASATNAADAAIYGVLSLIFWALIIVVTLKYVALILRADNRGEGGVLSLTALALRATSSTSRGRTFIIGISLLGVSLFAGDALITPAISILSAVEGLAILTPSLDAYLMPIGVAILIALFAFQSQGTARVGNLFGPIICVWFGALGSIGLGHIVQEPDILRAINPIYGLRLLETGNWLALAILGAVVLAVTGGEALYADMGHFGRFPIRAAWYGLVLPGLVLNYFGQGALILHDPDAATDPFFLMVPRWGLAPLLLLTTVATVIASQAVISGSFSLARQAVRLDYLPRMAIHHTSESEIGQIYVPLINWIMVCGVLILVVGFGSSSALAGAYGIAVMGTMVITTILASLVAMSLWHWQPIAVMGIFAPFLLVDFTFLGATLRKVPDGGWFPLLVAAVGCAVMWTWWRGRRVLNEKLYRNALPLETFLAQLGASTTRCAGTAVFMTGDVTKVPHALLHNLKHNNALHERVVIMTVVTEDIPRVPPEQRVAVERLGKGFHSVVARFGFMEQPHVPHAIELCRKHGLALDMMQTSFFLGRGTLVPSSRSSLPRWQQRLFIAMAANAMNATAFFELPPGRVVELGTQIEF